MQGESGLEAWFQGVTAGTPACVFCDDTEDAGNALAQFATSEVEPARVVTLTWNEVPPLGNELTLLVDAMSAAVLGYYPALYAREIVGGARSIGAAARSIAGNLPNVLGTACKQLLTSCAQGRAPKLTDLAKGEQVRQLALAIDPVRLVVVIAIKTAPAERLRLRSLAQGAEWLASNAQCRVVLVLPVALRCLSELDHITYASYSVDELSPQPMQRRPSGHNQRRTEQKPNDASAPTARPCVFLSPVIGKPHGEVEQALYDRLTSDAELRNVFAYNQHIVTCSQNQPIVDLVWQRGKLVIELDGDDHRGQIRFADDRKRDYWLVMSGYRVLRFTNASVIERCNEVVSMIRDAVRYLSAQEGSNEVQGKSDAGSATLLDAFRRNAGRA